MYNSYGSPRGIYFQREPYHAAVFMQPVRHMQIYTEPVKPKIYSPSYGLKDDKPSKRLTETHFVSPEIFLNPGREDSQFIDDAEKIRPFVNEAFLATMGSKLPDDITFRVCNAKQMKAFNPNWHPGIIGFAMNRLGFGCSEVFLLENNMDLLLLTAGHEIGHVLSFPLGNKVMEEAKAFAFEAAWLESVWKNDIAGLRNSINFSAFSPANNGIHDAAFSIVRRHLFFGEKPMDVFRQISSGRIN